ncbi:hypothetical protein OQH61_01750 [Helicobacter sp. MIT 21-1697]|uniref:hypothetical protein n=1 Tax=Helicobacter sp. MIT 21-1697 TaxID=2993733 RepID=UPI00224A8C04|nr:hypothetical protein [Helicobacter sp. MIT 21-1697]MCX2716459.1 hypothetical protein [Helicobacter sp. MIT 21-1697]
MSILADSVSFLFYSFGIWAIIYALPLLFFLASDIALSSVFMMIGRLDFFRFYSFFRRSQIMNLIVERIVGLALFFALNKIIPDFLSHSLVIYAIGFVVSLKILLTILDYFENYKGFRGKCEYFLYCSIDILTAFALLYLIYTLLPTHFDSFNEFLNSLLFLGLYGESLL